MSRTATRLPSQVATACFNHAAISGEVSLVLFDVT